MCVKFILITFCLGAAVFYSSCQLVRRKLTTERGIRLGIYQGNNTTIERHPYLVSVISFKYFWGAGVIVSNKWVLLNADDAYSLDASSTKVIAGSDDGWTGDTYHVEKIILHPEYKVLEYDYDYACMKIVGRFEWTSKTKPILLPSKEPRVNTVVVVAGWGATSSGSNVPSPIQEGHMKWFSKRLCKELYTIFGLTWTKTMACAYNKGKTTLCIGDESNPFVYDGVFYGMFLTGINIGDCTPRAYPLLLADILPVADWIKNNTGAKSDKD